MGEQALNDACSGEQKFRSFWRDSGQASLLFEGALLELIANSVEGGESEPVSVHKSGFIRESEIVVPRVVAVPAIAMTFSMGSSRGTDWNILMGLAWLDSSPGRRKSSVNRADPSSKLLTNAFRGHRRKPLRGAATQIHAGDGRIDVKACRTGHHSCREPLAADDFEVEARLLLDLAVEGLGIGGSTGGRGATART